MAENSKIEWCDHTFNPWIGCTKVSAGCDHCYAETLMGKRYKHVKWGKGQPRKRTSEANWRKPIKWNKDAESAEHWPRVFCASLSDWLDPEVPIEWLVDLLELIRQTSNLDWLLLTKRPELWSDRIEAVAVYIEGLPDWPDEHCAYAHELEDLRNWCADWLVFGKAPTNVWIGTTVENQRAADTRIAELLKIPSRIRFLSCEPLLGSVELGFDASCDHPRRSCEEVGCWQGVDWVICGGESGQGARPMDQDWAVELLDQCLANKTPFFFKQWGDHDRNGERVGKQKSGRRLLGREWNEFPEAKGGAS